VNNNTATVAVPRTTNHGSEVNKRAFPVRDNKIARWVRGFPAVGFSIQEYFAVYESADKTHSGFSLSELMAHSGIQLARRTAKEIKICV
jgi:hypothetical protein